VQKRGQANRVLQQYAQQVHDYFSALQNASQNADQGNFSTALVDNSALTAGTTFMAEQTDDTIPEAGVAIGALPASIGLWQKFHNESQNMNAHIALGFNIAAIGGFADDISNNVYAGFSEIAQNQTPNPVTGQIVNASLSLTSVTQETPGSWLPSQTIITPTQVTYITGVTADVTITNNAPSGSATFDVFARYAFAANTFGVQGDIPAASYAWATIPGGQAYELKWTLFDGNSGAVPSSSQPNVNFDVLGGNHSGIFYIASTSIGYLVGQSSLQNILKASPKPLDGGSGGTSRNAISLENPIRCYVNQTPSNQTYQAQIWVENLFVIPLTAVVTQTLPVGIGVSGLSTNGTLQNSSIVWTNVIAPSNSVENAFAFSLSITPNAQTNLPPPTVVFLDTNGNNLSLQGVAPNFSGLWPIQVSSSIPAGAFGIDSPMLIALTNFTSTGKTGSLTIALFDLSGNAVTNISQSFSLNGSGGTNVNFTLPGSLSAGSYTLTGSLSLNGGTGQVLAGNYVVPAHPVTLCVDLPAFDANGVHMVLNGPAGSNYLIIATSNLSNSTNWQAISFYSPTNMPFHFTVPLTTGAGQQFYRVMKL
jgi:hypothetical protein